MRTPAAVLAHAALAALAGGIWATGCTDLAGNCELKVECTPVTPPPECSNILAPGECDTCAEAACCKELADCFDDGACYNGCFYGFWPMAEYCLPSASPAADLVIALNACLATACSPACDAKDKCNPITDAGCNTVSQDCDAITPGVTECITPLGVAAKLCETCDIMTGPACGPGMRCFAGTKECARYCCDDKDCGTGKCVTDQKIVFGDPLLHQNVFGLCLKLDGTAPACDAPAKSPSNGACFTTYQPN